MASAYNRVAAAHRTPTAGLLLERVLDAMGTGRAADDDICLAMLRTPLDCDAWTDETGHDPT